MFLCTSGENYCSVKLTVFLANIVLFYARSCSSNPVEETRKKPFVEVSTGSKWPDGIVTYKLNDSITVKDKGEIQQAVDEYRSKTCIRFKEWQGEDDGPDFVEIKPIQWTHDIFPCHLSQHCRRGGNQSAWFGETCRDKTSFIHEFGHILCFSHGNTNSLKIPDGHPYWDEGLSKMEAGLINKEYNCKCHRHYWLPISMISEANKRNMPNFGVVDEKGRRLYPCRARTTATMTMGSFTFESGACRIWYIIEQNFTEFAEVLIIPGGFSAYAKDSQGNTIRYQYELINSHSISSLEEIDEEEDIMLVNVRNTIEKKKQKYIAFGSFSVKNEEKYWKMEGIGAFGKSDRGILAIFAGAGKRVYATNFKILVCRKSNLDNGSAPG